jgi:uncharacterized protein (DUF885 family)
MRLFLIAVTALVLSGCGGGSPSADARTGTAADKSAAEHARLTAYLDAEYEKELAMSPEELTSEGRKEQYDKLDDYSDEGEERQLAWRRKSVADMKASFDYNALDPDARISYDIWSQALDRSERRRTFRRHPYIFVRGGAHTGFPQFLINFHRVDDKHDMEAYVSRLNAMHVALSQLLARAKAAAADGIRPPAFAYEQALDEVKRVTTGAPFDRGPDSALLADAKAKIGALQKNGKISAEEAQALTANATKALTESVKPAYDQIAAWLATDRRNASVEPKGAGSLPDGANYYNTALYLQTTTTMTADEIHAIGLTEVERLRREMEAIKDRVGFKGTLPEFFKFMRQDRQFYFPNTDAGRAAYLAQAESYLTEMKKKLPEYFGLLPKADLVVKRVEAFREEPGGAQHYFAGTPDGSRPGIFYAHLSDMNAMPKFQLEDVAYHEGVPGHHLQVSIARERTGLPKFRTQYGFGAFSEGWGLYSESLAKEMGFFTDPYSDFGRVSGEMWRAIRLVVDTGMHAKGWSEKQATDFFLANSPLPETTVRSEIHRYLANPGQATSYKIGMMTIQRLRDEARTALGQKFDYRAFHDVVLGGGSVPLPVLESRVKAWVASQQAARPTS